MTREYMFKIEESIYNKFTEARKIVSDTESELVTILMESITKRLEIMAKPEKKFPSVVDHESRINDLEAYVTELKEWKLSTTLEATK